MERLVKVDQIKALNSKEIKKSRIGIGFEKLDRNVFDPEKAYDKMADLGVKWVRIQSGWERTEVEKGVYDFTWLDSIVDNLIERGMLPWMCLCYGHGLYNEEAAKVFGAVGCPPITNEEEKQAWVAYVEETVRRYKGRVVHFEIWNEPDGIWCWKHGVSGEEYSAFAIDTAKAIKKANPEAQVFGGSICHRNLDWFNTVLSNGLGQYIDAVTFHEYTHDERLVYERVAALKALCKAHGADIKIIQGESGSQSKSGGNGALRAGSWTQRKQAKQLLRHTVADLSTDVMFTSYFTCVDMIEALNGSVDDKSSYLDYGYFGVLAAEFDENGFSTGEYNPKASYYALQNLCSLFAEDTVSEDLPIILDPSESKWIFGRDLEISEVATHGFTKPNGSMAFAYWHTSNIMTTDYEGTITMQAVTLGKDVKLVDPMDGSVYEIPQSMIEDCGDGCLIFKHLPAKDYPLLLTFGDFYTGSGII
jgi:hypothetical protein